jgi:hypothetical protein
MAPTLTARQALPTSSPNAYVASSLNIGTTIAIVAAIFVAIILIVCVISAASRARRHRRHSETFRYVPGAEPKTASRVYDDADDYGLPPPPAYPPPAYDASRRQGSWGLGARQGSWGLGGAGSRRPLSHWHSRRYGHRN